MSVTEHLAAAEIAFKRFRIPHPRVDKIADAIDVLRAVGCDARLEWESGGCRGKRPEQKFLPILAPSGSGKSTAIRSYLEKRLANMQPQGIRPVVHVTLSEQASPARAAADILEEYGDPDFEEGTGTKRIKRAGVLMDLARTETLIIDEMQHLINKDTGAKTATGVTQMIKRMLIRGAAPLVLVGTMEAEPVLLSDNQMKNRCLPPLFLPPLNVEDKKDKKTWVQHCAGFDIELVRHGIFQRSSNLVGDDIPAYAMELSSGVIGTASRFFEVAAAFAIQRGAPCIEWDDLHDAVRDWAIPLRFVTVNRFDDAPAPRLRSRRDA